MILFLDKKYYFYYPNIAITKKNVLDLQISIFFKLKNEWAM